MWLLQFHLEAQQQNRLDLFGNIQEVQTTSLDLANPKCDQLMSIDVYCLFIFTDPSMSVATAYQADNRNDLKLDLCEPVVEAQSVHARYNKNEVNTCNDCTGRTFAAYRPIVE